MTVSTAKERVGAVLIGRNEGERLRRALAAMAGEVARMVYVDSGSTDGSVDAALAAGAEVVELDMSVPFTAARARNAGYAALTAKEAPEFVQFIDGDCEIVAGWVARGVEALTGDEALGIVTGWRTEIHPEQSVYNKIADFEWRGPSGEIDSCGGDMLVRRAAFEAVSGFDASLIVSEDYDFCLRLGRAGWRLERLPLPMTRHDLAMTRFGEWWKRTVRSGYGYEQVGRMYPDFYRSERRRMWLYGALVPVVTVAALPVTPFSLPVAAGIYGASFANTCRGLLRAGQPVSLAIKHAALLTISKVPNMQGALTYWLRRARGKEMRLIEYK